MYQNKFFNDKITKNLFVASIFLIFFIAGNLIYTDYGFYIDEKFHRANGFYWLNYISNYFGLDSLSQISSNKLENIRGFTLPNISEWNAYGIIFDVPAAYLEIILNLDNQLSFYLLRHYLVFILFFLSSIYFYKILDNRFQNGLVSILGLILFILTPRVFGDGFWNNKDIVFLSFYTIAIYFYFKTMENQILKNILLLSFFSALSTTIRFAGIFLPISLILFLLIDKISRRNDLMLKTVLINLIFFFIFLFITWPYLWTNFTEGILSSFNLDMAWSGKVNFLGKYYMSNNLPYFYLVFWIVITTPLIHLFLFFYGIGNYVKRFLLRYFSIKNKSFHNDLWRSLNEKKDLFIFINLVFFLTFLSFLNVSLYNGWRLGYFLYIFIIYFSTYGIYLLVIKFKDKIKIFVTISFFALVFLIYRLNLYHPYQSLYFNLAVPKTIKNNVDVDYFGLSGFLFLEDLIKTEETFPIKVAANSWYPLWRMTELFSDVERKKIQVFGHDKKDKVDYLYSNRIYDVDNKFYKKYDIPKNFRKLKEFKIDNTIIYEVYKRFNK